jgi:catechol 2,3-dioxygenase-like lactoylglutathione lyase family enzyme
MAEAIISGLLKQYENGKLSRRDLVRGLALTGGALAGTAGPALAGPDKGFKAVAVNHISYGVADYARTRDFYADLLGMHVSNDTGKECTLSFGETLLIVRKTRHPEGKPVVDHISYTIENWDKNAVEAELRRRGHDPRPDTDLSFHIKDPDGYDLQIEANDVALYNK